ncbi:hypothetical protein [Microbacterium sp.]|uniref:hypothetical protein n=1 Tax=Microbacterium sp. TaxID=51671 RepID=UPI0039E54A0C
MPGPAAEVVGDALEREPAPATPWWRALRADRAVRDALDELFLLEASTPPRE